MSITFTKPSKPSVHFKAWVAGDAGSGKTHGALHLATGLAEGGKIALASTEQEGAAFVEGVDFDMLEWLPPYTVQRAAEIIGAAVQAGYKVLIFDSGSSLYEDDGGLISQVEASAQSRASRNNSYASTTVADWKRPKQESKDFWKDVVLPAPIHILFTIRAEEAVVNVGGTAKGDEAWKKTRRLSVDRKRRFDVHTTFLLAPEGDGLPGEAEPHTVSFLKDRIGLKKKLGTPRYLDAEYGRRIAALLKVQGAPTEPGKPTSTNDFHVKSRTNDDDKARTELFCDNSVKVIIPYRTPGLDALPSGGDYSVRVTGAHKKVQGWDVYMASRVEVSE